MFHAVEPKGKQERRIPRRWRCFAFQAMSKWSIQTALPQTGLSAILSFSLVEHTFEHHCRMLLKLIRQALVQMLSGIVMELFRDEELNAMWGIDIQTN